MNELRYLFSPMKIRNMELANRCVMPPMGTGLANSDGTVSEANLAYIKRQAQRGGGLVITEIAGIHPSGAVGIGAYDDKFIPGLKEMARTIHQAGPKAALQLHHAGREAAEQLNRGEAIGPSAIPSRVYGKAPREMTADDIQMIITSFGQAAIRAREAGFDAVELHGAHGYLLAQFLSAISNQRADEYGGDFKNRARFIIEIIKETRKSVGGDFPVLIRISAEEYIKNGYLVEDMQTIVPDFVEAGVDVIHASVGTHGSPGGVTSATAEFEEGWNIWRAQKLKQVTAIPIIGVGRFTDPRAADEVIARGEADMIAFGRQTLADPDYLIKAREGRFDDIRRCLACNQGCIERLMFEGGKSVRCAINPETGQELIYPKGPAESSKNVWIIGAGPAGLTAAYEAARLGHMVTLFEKEKQVGGQIRYASQAPYKKIYGEWISWLIKQIEKKGVDIQTGTEVTAEMLDESKADVVILASGGESIRPEIQGLNQSMVCEATQILSGHVQPGKNVVVIGGGLIGMETADYLTDKGSKVTIIEMLERSPVTKVSGHGYQLHKRLSKVECDFRFNTQIKQVQSDSVRIISGDKEETLSPVDQVVLAVGMQPRHDLKKALEEKGIAYYVVGDASEVRRIIEATEEGAKAAWDT